MRHSAIGCEEDLSGQRFIDRKNMIVPQILVNGLVLTVIYALLALGLNIVFGVLRILNFAHGAFLTLGAYCLYYLVTAALQVHFIPAFIIAFVLIGLFGLIIERGLLRPVIKNLLVVMIITLALSNLIEGSANIIFGVAPKSPPTFLSGVIQFGAASISLERVAVVITGACLLLLALAIINRTKIGEAMRAVAQDDTAAALQGINVGRIYSFGMFLSSGLAGMAGALLASLIPITPTMGSGPLLTCFVIIILGGLGSIPGAIIGAAILGFTESVVTTYFGGIVASIVGFSLMAIILLVKPRGLLGKA